MDTSNSPLRSLARRAGALGLLALTGLSASAQSTSEELTKLDLADGAPFDNFGRSVLVSGNVALFGANGDDTMGAMHCYRRVGGVWTFDQKFRGNDTAQGDFFGFEARMDGNLAVVGAYQFDTPAINAGAAYVFQDDGNDWTQVQKLVAFDGAASDNFGAAVALGGDLIVIGARDDGDAGNSAGSVYVYRRSGATWSFEQKLFGSTTDAVDEFGWDVDTDGTTIVVSAVSDETGADETGAVFVFAHDGTSWQETQRFVPAGASDGDRFGWALDLDGDALAIGATNHDDPAVDGGAVYVYRRSGATWLPEQKLAPSKLAGGDSLGWSVSLRGNRLVAGAPGTPVGEGGFGSGALYQFHHDGTGWVEVHQWVPGDPGGAGFVPPQLGMSCTQSNTTVFGGAPFADGPLAAGVGAVYAYTPTDLGLDAVPDVLPNGGTLELETYGGFAGFPMAGIVVSVGATPLNLLLAVDFFDPAGKQVFTLPISPTVSGVSVTFLTAGFWNATDLALSNPVTVFIE